MCIELIICAIAPHPVRVIRAAQLRAALRAIHGALLNVTLNYQKPYFYLLYNQYKLIGIFGVAYLSVT